MKDIHQVIRTLNRIDTTMFNEEIADSITNAVAYLMQYSPKPPMTAHVFEIKYYTGANVFGKKSWQFHRHVPSRKYIDDMTIEELCALVKSGNFDKDLFDASGDKQFKLPWNIGTDIIRMLVMNGYLKQEEVPKMRWNK